MDESEALGDELDIQLDPQSPSFATAMWKHFSGFAPDMIVTLNILLTELEIQDYDISNSSVPTHLRTLLNQETNGDPTVTHAYLLSIRESVEAGVAEQETIAAAAVPLDEGVAYQLQLEEEAAALSYAGSPATSTAEAVTTEQPRGCAEQVGASRPGVGQS